VAIADGGVVEVGRHDQLMAAKGFCHDLCMTGSEVTQHRRRSSQSNTKLTGVPGPVATCCLARRRPWPQARALAFSRSNSDWSIAPVSSSSLARAICSVGVVSPVAATLRT
jgi:hypothetical protein